MRDDQGQAMVIFVLALLVLLCFVGLAIDGGAALAQRRGMQNAADAAALAGARELDVLRQTIPNPTQAQVWARINEYAVTRNHATTFTAKQYPTLAALGNISTPTQAAATGVCVTAQFVYSTQFMRLIGLETLTIEAPACASKAPATSCMGGYTLWADSLSCGGSLFLTGTNWDITGLVHTNNNIEVYVNHVKFTGRVEYVTTQTIGNTKEFYNPSAPTNPIKDMVRPRPVTYNLADYQPGGSLAVAAGAKYYYHSGDYNLSGPSITIPTGLHYVKGNVNISGNSTGTDVTIVAEGIINISGSTINYSPYSDGLLFFSNKEFTGNNKCDSAVLAASASSTTWSGIMYAPRGLIALPGSGIATYNGSAIGNTVRIYGGSSTVMKFAPQYCPASTRGKAYLLVTPL